jgi:hypothetical protein
MNSFLNLLEQNLFTCIPSISKPTNLEEENLSETTNSVTYNLA